VVNLLGILSG